MNECGNPSFTDLSSTFQRERSLRVQEFQVIVNLT